MPDTYEPLDGRRQAVLVVFAAIALISVVATISDVLEIRLMDRLIAGEPVTASEADANDGRQALVGIVQFAALVAGAIVFIRWLHGAYRNVDVVDRAQRRYGHGWAIGSWFVPFLNLWRPKQIVNDVWRAGARDESEARPGLLLLAWWLAFVISNSVANIAIRSTFGDSTPEEIRDGSIAYAISDGIDVMGAVLAILVVRAATDRLDGRAATLTPSPESPGGGWQAPERPAGLPA
jgi:uncharacterized protein DUF4328